MADQWALRTDPVCQCGRHKSKRPNGFQVCVNCDRADLMLGTKSP